LLSESGKGGERRRRLRRKLVLSTAREAFEGGIKNESDREGKTGLGSEENAM